ncbi:5-methyltetrahydropteroyltriglutamate--homocysteine methyltransferase [Diplonema papillatum]|nr:5-methyltetrahydropteroyltriglutamate--homocysteine methyltransferase [Diplonema papillatum]
MPLKTEDAWKYMDWAVKAFRYSTAVAKPSTQIVTHMCYSSFEDTANFIDEMDADVLTIENSRSESTKCLPCLLTTATRRTSVTAPSPRK